MAIEKPTTDQNDIEDIRGKLYKHFDEDEANKELFKKNREKYESSRRQFIEPLLRIFIRTGKDPLEVQVMLSKRFAELNQDLYQKDSTEYQKARKQYVNERFRNWVNGKDSLNDLEKKVTDEKPEKKSGLWKVWPLSYLK